MRRWSSPGEISASVGQVLMETCWVHALWRVITSLAPSALEVRWGRLVALQLLAVMLARCAGAIGGAIVIQRAAVALLAGPILLAFVAVHLSPSAARPALAALLRPWEHGVPIGGPLTLLTWLVGSFLTARGVLIGSRSSDAASARRWFQIGAIVLVGLYALLARGGVSAAMLPVTELHVLTAGYFLGGCVVCALAERQSADLRQRVALQHMAAFALALATPVLLLGLGALLLAAGALGVSVLVHHVQDGALWLLQGAWMGLRWLAHGLAHILRLLGTGLGSAPRETARNGSGLIDPPFGLGRWHNPLARTDWDALPAVLTLLCALVVGLFLISWLRARVAAPPSELLEDSSSLISWDNLALRWRARLSGARALLQQRRGELIELVRAARMPRDMRALYRQVLRWAAARGHARRSATTPLELAEELARHYPERSHELQTLTAYYNAARYGERAPSAAELSHARELLEALLREPR